MPAWSGKLTDAQIDSLSAYIRSFSMPAARWRQLFIRADAGIRSDH